MSKHTPGEWILEIFDNGSWHIYTKKGMIVASRNSYQAKRDEFHANARLFYAAPDLLEALKNLIEYESNIIPIDRQSTEYKLAITAIRKAEGGDA